jgi:hypothetical protein
MHWRLGSFFQMQKSFSRIGVSSFVEWETLECHSIFYLRVPMGYSRTPLAMLTNINNNFLPTNGWEHINFGKAVPPLDIVGPARVSKLLQKPSGKRVGHCDIASDVQ